MKKLLSILKQDAVLTVSFCLALVSSFFVPPSANYISYIDFRVLALLLSLMLSVAGLRQGGIFSALSGKLLLYVKNTRALALLFVLLSFFSSMVITNDVALITFVPFALLLLTETGQGKLYIPVLVLMTVAANLGSMLTPLGNPQNLYLYSLSGMDMGAFLQLMAIPTGISLLLLCLACLFIKPEKIVPPQKESAFSKKDTVFFLFLFSLSLLSVFHVLHFGISLLVTILCVFFYRRHLLLGADYALLLTFIFFFIFVGNIKEIPAVSAFLSSLTAGREITVSVLLSQVISNVPCAMLLSGFTNNYPALLLGVNLGGLGTLIASMASLISFKQYGSVINAKKGKYLLVFTLVNFVFLAVLWLLVSLIP